MSAIPPNAHFQWRPPSTEEYQREAKNEYLTQWGGIGAEGLSGYSKGIPKKKSGGAATSESLLLQYLEYIIVMRLKFLVRPEVSSVNPDILSMVRFSEYT